jgi:dihydrofolate reductase
MKYYVFSRRARRKALPGVEWVHRDAAGFVKRLKEADGKDILVMGGGVLFRYLLAHDFIDEILLNIQPIVLGKGIPLFDGRGPRVALELKAAKPHSDGTVGVEYAVRRGVARASRGG